MRHLLFLLLLLFAGCSRSVRQVPLPAQAYVWQRRWTAEVSAAVRTARFEALHVLVAEWGIKQDKYEITLVEPDWQALADSGGQVGAVLRVHASVGKLGWNEALVQQLRELCGDIVARFKAGGAPLTELQLDYDCAESRLADYARLLDSLKLDVPLRITALPAWLRHDSARDLLARSPGYVLQVHSLHLPTQGGLTGLMDMDETRTAVRRAEEIGVPFRVALPTYSCVVEFTDDGRVREVHGEDMPTGLALSGRKYAVLDSDAYALSELVADWRAHASALMQAVIWYRLPVSSDRLNWPPGLLPKVARGEPLKRGWTVSVQLAPEGHQEIVLNQAGEAPDDLPHEVRVSWQGGDVAGCDGLRGYRVQKHAPGQLVLWLGQPARFGRVQSGEQIVAGWLRLPEDAGAGVTAKIFR
jgi:hypothetical protein